MNRPPLITLTFFALALTASSSVAEQLLTATCGPLSGTKVALVDGKATTAPESQVAPFFFVDSENPKMLVSLWKSKILDKKEEYKYKAIIVEFNSKKLQAIERDVNGLYTYTIFLDSGTLLYSHHRLRSFFDSGPTLLSFVGKCEINRGR